MSLRRRWIGPLVLVLGLAWIAGMQLFADVESPWVQPVRTIEGSAPAEDPADEVTPQKVATVEFHGAKSTVRVVWLQPGQPVPAKLWSIPSAILPVVDPMPQSGTVELAENPVEPWSLFFDLGSDDVREFELAARAPGSEYVVEIARWSTVHIKAPHADGAEIWLSLLEASPESQGFHPQTSHKLIIGPSGEGAFEAVRPGRYQAWIAGAGWHAANNRQELKVSLGQDSTVEFETRKVFLFAPKFMRNDTEVRLPRQLTLRANLQGDGSKSMVRSGPVFIGEFFNPMPPDLRSRLVVEHAEVVTLPADDPRTELTLDVSIRELNRPVWMVLPQRRFTLWGPNGLGEELQPLDLATVPKEGWSPLEVELIDETGQPSLYFGAIGANGDAGSYHFFLPGPKTTLYLPHATYSFETVSTKVLEMKPWIHQGFASIVIPVQRICGDVYITVQRRAGNPVESFVVHMKHRNPSEKYSIGPIRYFPPDGQMHFRVPTGDYELHVRDPRNGRATSQPVSVDVGAVTRVEVTL